MKLNLGCGADFKEGYLNIDTRVPQQESEIEKKAKKFDFKQSDVSNLSWMDNETVEKIMAKDILDHIHWKALSSTFAEWKRVLKRGGILHIRKIPDFEKATRNYFQSDREEKDWQELQKWVEHLSCPHEHMRSKNLMDSVHLEKMLKDQGFIIEKIWTDTEGINIDCKKP